MDPIGTFGYKGYVLSIPVEFAGSVEQLLSTAGGE
jgi:hypothetical protein